MSFKLCETAGIDLPQQDESACVSQAPVHDQSLEVDPGGERQTGPVTAVKGDTMEPGGNRALCQPAHEATRGVVKQ